MKYLVLLTLLLSNGAWNGQKVYRSETEWRCLLGPERYRVMRGKQSDGAFMGKYVYPTKQEGAYLCAACELPLFLTQDQYDAGSGFPSFKKPVHAKHVYYEEDYRLPFKRYEILCRQCDSHLGHVFHDGPPTKRLRYCVNSTSLKLKIETPNSGEPKVGEILN